MNTKDMKSYPFVPMDDIKIEKGKKNVLYFQNKINEDSKRAIILSLKERLGNKIKKWFTFCGYPEYGMRKLEKQPAWIISHPVASFEIETNFCNTHINFCFTEQMLRSFITYLDYIFTTVTRGAVPVSATYTKAYGINTLISMLACTYGRASTEEDDCVEEGIENSAGITCVITQGPFSENIFLPIENVGQIVEYLKKIYKL